MTTSRSDRRPAAKGAALVSALLLGATPLAAADPMPGLELPSGLFATLYDVVLEEGDAVLAPDAFTDPEAAEEGPAADEEEPLDQPPAADPLGEEAGAPAGGVARFRLKVEGLGGEGAGFDAVAGDFAWLCEELALPALAANGWTPLEVVIALSDREVEFGVIDPEAVQYFEGFRIADGTCVPQAF
jgi:hypothetical protein